MLLPQESGLVQGRRDAVFDGRTPTDAAQLAVRLAGSTRSTAIRTDLPESSPTAVTELLIGTILMPAAAARDECHAAGRRQA